MSTFRALWQASLNATKRALTWNLEDLIPPSERYIFNINSKEELKKWHLYSDSEYGGLFSASLEIRDAGNELRGVLRGKGDVQVSCTALTWNLEDLIPPSKRYVFNFNSKEKLKKWHLYSDSEYGGLSSASLEIRDAGNELRGVFSGKLSPDVAEDSKWNISQSGFCGMRSKKFDGFIDLDAYDTIALKVKGEGRCYISTIYMENWVNSPGQEEDNSWQAFVFVPRDNWYIAKILLARYLPTWRGNVIDVDLEMNPSRIVGMSLSVNAEGGVPGASSGLQVIFKWKSIGLKP